MSDGLLYFAIPIAVIIFSIALQKILRSPTLVGLIIFAIFLVVTFVLNDMTWLVLTIVYTLIAWITAYIVALICRCKERLNESGFFQNTFNSNIQNQGDGDAELNAALANLDNDIRDNYYGRGRGCRRRIC